MHFFHNNDGNYIFNAKLTGNHINNREISSHRWFDKSFQVVVFKNGRFGMNAEHSWADAPVLSHLTEEVLYEEFVAFKYKEDGRCDGELTTTPLPPIRLKWSIPEKVRMSDAFFLAEVLTDQVVHFIQLKSKSTRIFSADTRQR